MPCTMSAEETSGGPLQVVIAKDEHLGVALDGGLDHHVVVWVAADPDGADHLGKLACFQHQEYGLSFSGVTL